MIHYEKSSNEDKLIIDVPSEVVGEVYDALCQAGLLQRRTFHGLKTYIEKEFAGELAAYRSRMTAQRPRKEGGVC